MKTIPILAALCAAVMALPSPSLAGETKTYPLKLNRPFKAGQKTHDRFKAVMSKSQRVSQGEKVFKEEATGIRAELSGVTEVREVTPGSKVRRLTFKVEKFTLTAGTAAEVQPFKPGTIIEATGVEDRKKKFEVDGKEVTGPAAEALKEFFSLSGPGKKETDDEAVYGSAGPRAPGSEWDINGKSLLETLTDAPFVLTEKEVSGTVKFTGVREQAGVPCCELKMEVTMNPSSFKGMPEGFKLSKVDIKSSGVRMVPVAATGIIPAETLEQRVDFTGTFPTGDGPVNLEFTNRSSKERISRPVK